MGLFASLDTELQKDLLNFVEEREKLMSYRNHGEADEQETVIAWAAWGSGQYPELGLIFHIPNGGSRNAIEAKNLKRQGVKAGVPDLFLPASKHGYHGLWIEMKYGKNRTTPKQDWWINHLKKQGYFVRVCYGADEAIKVICSYLGIPDVPDTNVGDLISRQAAIDENRTN